MIITLTAENGSTFFNPAQLVSRLDLGPVPSVPAWAQPANIMCSQTGNKQIILLYKNKPKLASLNYKLKL